MQLQVNQQEKLSTLGQLVAGVAHEINNPVGFILSNLPPAREYVAEIAQILQLYQQHYPEPAAEIEQAIAAAELEYALADLPEILDSMQVGADRIRDISASLRRFSRLDANTKVAANIHEGLESALLILGHRLKACNGRPAIAVLKEYSDLPEVECYPGQLNQVFMNILSNAIDALEMLTESERAEILPTPTIRIRTEVLERDRIIVCIRDNGPGMTVEIQQQIFDPLFTTKSTNRGTGLGLSISRQIVADTHSGQLTCHSAIGEGTEFVITLPIFASDLPALV